MFHTKELVNKADSIWILVFGILLLVLAGIHAMIWTVVYKFYKQLVFSHKKRHNSLNTKMEDVKKGMPPIPVEYFNDQYGRNT